MFLNLNFVKGNVARTEKELDRLCNMHVYVVL